MYPRTHRRSLLGIFSVAAALGVVVACTKPEPPRTTQVSPVERGLYLVNVVGCGDCHTPKLFTANGPEPDKTRLLSGHPADAKLPSVPPGIIGPDQWGALANNELTAWAGPWGVSYTANLTPDATGLGSWTPEIFIQAMRTGKHAGTGRDILPPMPWMDFALMTDEDLRAVFAYLKSLPPISNVVPAPVPPAPDSAPGE
ncbi:MAG: putative lipoprotein [Gammaproteobacteria bacterium]|nr:MAG: putative lipoprotein [Gammaproteobacteria bacterium]TND01770.1 MAG: putative lipoprotein [Gammaproteobacteria bacterium]